MATALEAIFIQYRILPVFISLPSHLLIDIAPTARMSPSSQENGMRNLPGVAHHFTISPFLALISCFALLCTSEHIFLFAPQEAVITRFHGPKSTHASNVMVALADCIHGDAPALLRRLTMCSQISVDTLACRLSYCQIHSLGAAARKRRLTRFSGASDISPLYELYLALPLAYATASPSSRMMWRTTFSGTVTGSSPDRSACVT